MLTTEISPPDAHTRAALRFDRIMAGLTVWLIGGLFLDGWAHHHLPDLESFITPWHGVFYSGFLVMTVFLVGSAARSWRSKPVAAQAEASTGIRRLFERSASLLPAGYEFALIGVLVFWAGGVGDFIWHTLFGVEVDVEALLSPTHLLLAFGMSLMVVSPVRAAWNRASGQGARASWVESWPSIVAYTGLLSLATFFTQFANPIVESWAYGATPGISAAFAQEFGAASLILTAMIITGAVLIAQSGRWPFGAMTVMLTANAAALSVFDDAYLLIPAGLLAGMAADLIRSRLAANVFVLAITVPAIFVASVLGILGIAGHLDWSIHLWAGAVVMAAVFGGLLALVARRPRERAVP
ncbi:MAG: hypothetical protein EPN91_07435 [Salinibacterium sp.]|nr:MAG: hypothetical protein EPN91_07435 [Salinibacterium sp.]